MLWFMYILMCYENLQCVYLDICTVYVYVSVYTYHMCIRSTVLYIRIEIIVSFKINDYVYILYILSGLTMLIHVGYLILLSRSLSFCSARPMMSIQVNRMALPGPCGKETVSRLIFLVPNSGLLHDWFLQVDLGRMITAFPSRLFVQEKLH